MRPSPASLSTVLLLAVTTVASPQSIQGVLIDNVNQQPLPGAFVTLIDAAGKELARALTGPAGRYVLQTPGPGAYRLRTKRIGFRPQTSEPLRVEVGQSLTYRLVLDPIPVALPERVVAADTQCEIDGPGVQAATLWEEVREALSAVSWSARVPGYWYETVLFERDRPSIHSHVRRDTTWSRTGFLHAPFRSAPPEELASQGYIARDANDIVYFGPDADALLSDPFVRTHCFDVTIGRGRESNLIGLHFVPVPERYLTDVEGTLWLDRRTSELRHLDFAYTHLPQHLSTVGARGRIDFLRVPSGAWIVREWVIRMPLVRPTGPIWIREAGGQTLTIKNHSGESVYAVMLPAPDRVARDSNPRIASDVAPEAPGASGTCPDSLLRTGRGVAQGVVRDRSSSAGVPDAEIWATWQEVTRRGTLLQTSELRADTRTDASGAYRMCGLPVGRKITLVVRLDRTERTRASRTLSATAESDRIWTQDFALSNIRRPSSSSFNPDVLTFEDVDRSTLLDAYALVQQLRPSWLHRRGPISMRDPNAGQVLVYVDGMRQGRIQELRNIPLSTVRAIRHLDAATATQRFGTGHAGGVIEVLLR